MSNIYHSDIYQFNFLCLHSFVFTFLPLTIIPPQLHQQTPVLETTSNLINTHHGSPEDYSAVLLSATRFSYCVEPCVCFVFQIRYCRIFYVFFAIIEHRTRCFYYCNGRLENDSLCSWGKDSFVLELLIVVFMISSECKMAVSQSAALWSLYGPMRVEMRWRACARQVVCQV